tara:strand:+ start:17252 stop:17776 length:525 start_codon:yes stop_codon:yes gene_type:complete
MISTKKKKMTPEDRKKKVSELRVEHEKYLDTVEGSPLYIPKMAYRPSGKDELHISFFPSELEKKKDVYTEFVSKDYESEDPKRTLYLCKYNENWEEDYELMESNSGFQTHLVPVNSLKIINDVNSRNTVQSQHYEDINLEESKESNFHISSGIEAQLERIADQLIIITHYLKNK